MAQFMTFSSDFFDFHSQDAQRACLATPDHSTSRTWPKFLIKVFRRSGIGVQLISKSLLSCSVECSIILLVDAYQCVTDPKEFTSNSPFPKISDSFAIASAGDDVAV